MFQIHSQDFEKIAISLSNIARNIDAMDVVGFLSDKEPIGDKLSNIVKDKIKNKFKEKITEELDTDDPTIPYYQQKLKVIKPKHFKFHKIAANIIPTFLHKPLRYIGIADEERKFLSQRFQESAREKAKSELYNTNERDKV